MGMANIAKGNADASEATLACTPIVNTHKTNLALCPAHVSQLIRAKVTKSRELKTGEKQNDLPGAFISVHQKHVRYYNSKRLLIIVMLKNQSDFDTVLQKLFLYTFFSTLVYTFHFIIEATAEISKLYKAFEKYNYLFLTT